MCQWESNGWPQGLVSAARCVDYWTASPVEPESRQLLRNLQLRHLCGFDGEVSCVCPSTGTERSMSYGGIERDRNT